ncbi:MAG: COX15/CtaA family protein [Acidobacteria bacterium]|nr:COX15/CtaA family protein [Acidobacteriota bacterium]
MSKIERFLFSLLVFLQAAIVVTGGAVRLTGSGLGCPTWPECTPGSITPVKGQIEGEFHSWIEFGNRLLTFVLLFSAIAVIVIVIRRDAKDLRWLAAGQLAGIFGQGVLGGITVLTDLNPIPVAGHFLLSILLIGGALSLRQRALGKDLKIQLRPITKKLAQSVLLISVLVVVLGTVVTGNGPHAGDAQAKRFNFDPRLITRIHADVVIVFVLLTIALLIAVRMVEDAGVQQKFGRKVLLLLFVSLAQGGIGFVQYFNGVPILLVGFHLLGATLVWISTWNLAITGKVFTR